MHTAVICLAYLCNPAGVGLLAEYFSGTDADLYLHVDAKVDSASYAKVCEEWHRLFMLEKRIPIHWGGFNTVKAVMAALESIRLDKKYERFVLLTEDTIPIVSRAEFTARMASDREFIDIRLARSDNLQSRYSGFFYFDAPATSPRPYPINDRQITDEVLHALDRMQNLRKRGKVNLSALYHGSTWWALSRGSVDVLLDSFQNDHALRESFEFSAIPEEQYFHTVLSNSISSRGVKTQPLMFTDWSRKPTPYVFRSASEIQSLDTLCTTFLRKVPLGSAAMREFVLGIA